MNIELSSQLANKIAEWNVSREHYKTQGFNTHIQINDHMLEAVSILGEVAEEIAKYKKEAEEDHISDLIDRVQV